MSEAPIITPDMLKALRILHHSKPFGCARWKGNRWRSHKGSIDGSTVSGLVLAKLARKDYSGRTPRAVITGAGTRTLGKLSPRSL